MGCGCGKGGSRNTSRSTPITPNVNRSVSPGQANSNNISQQSLSPRPENKNISGDRREVERMRREAIRRALGR